MTKPTKPWKVWSKGGASPNDSGSGAALLYRLRIIVTKAEQSEHWHARENYRLETERTYIDMRAIFPEGDYEDS